MCSSSSSCLIWAHQRPLLSSELQAVVVLCTLLGLIRQIFHRHKPIFDKTCLPCPQSALVQCSHTGFFGFFGACLLVGLMQYKVCGNTQGICGLLC